MSLTLISHALCPYVQRAVIALTEKQIDFQRIDIDLAKKPAWFLTLSPLGKTPLLKVGDAVVFESAVICEYLEEVTGTPLHPADPLDRARHRSWIEFSSALLNTVWALYTAKDERSFDTAVTTLADRFGRMEAVLGDGPFFAGDRFSLVDAAFGPVFRYFDVFDAFNAFDGVDLFAPLPKTRAWRSALMQRPSVRTAVSADYPSLLREFVIAQQGVLGKRLAAGVADVGRFT